MKMSGDDLLPRIMAKVEIVEGGCWLWHGLVASNGLTPRFRFSKDGKRLEFSVRRVLYEHYIGEPPKNIHVSCGNPRCVNPAHFVLSAGRRRVHGEKPIDRLRRLARRCGFELRPAGEKRWRVCLMS